MKNRSLAYSLAYFPLCFVVVRRSLGHALYVRSLLRGFHASPTEKYPALIFLSARLSIRRHAVLCVVALPLTYLMYAPRPRSLHALPDNEYAALSVFADSLFYIAAEEKKYLSPSSSPFACLVFSIGRHALLRYGV